MNNEETARPAVETVTRNLARIADVLNESNDDWWWFHNTVTGFDFASLYPKIIITREIDRDAHSDLTDLPPQKKQRKR